MLRIFKRIWVKLFHPKIANDERPKYPAVNDSKYGVMHLGRFTFRRRSGRGITSSCRTCGRRHLSYSVHDDIH